MNNKGFKVIQGGLDTPFEAKEKEFISAYVTNTRLMGVVAMCIKWKVIDCGIPGEFYQLFYYDAEEYGLDTYKGYSNRDMALFKDAEMSMIGGLGGQKIPIGLEEAKYLIRLFVNHNLAHGITLPEGRKDYMFLVQVESPLNDEGAHRLMGKMCGKIQSDYQLINYFVMRCFGKDFTAADYLTSGFKTKDYWPTVNSATLCKNTIDRVDRPYGNFMCESVLDVNGTYYIATSLIRVENQQVVNYEPKSLFKVSPLEASLTLSRPEFITAVDYIGHMDDFNRYSTPLTEKSMITQHEFGQVYMIFNPTNGHVDKQIFRLNGDVFGVYYHSDENQLLLAAYSQKNIEALEEDLMSSKIGTFCIPQGRYQFEEPVLFKFIQSGYERFEDFIEVIKKE